ncbi:hypothetical protein Mmc1_1774 [Magnetococcus marinus MC-1]|uniref:Uncharacterized protein n=1 Tax=Magnetococcus marinus (strain ATCC BAA-1437 / JCM 17883 / MC-1) TaxID=156889 RepID=A0L8I9_MAGMM|nr:hypothetical protein [Magnetococcus marinus]ABK44282.1 hypothetical protein Mmc1_1774 [Magnetococcus marinus MC-1]
MAVSGVSAGGTLSLAQNARRLDQNQSNINNITSSRQQTLNADDTGLNSQTRRVNSLTRTGDDGFMSENASKVVLPDVNSSAARPGGIIDIFV